MNPVDVLPGGASPRPAAETGAGAAEPLGGLRASCRNSVGSSGGTDSGSCPWRGRFVSDALFQLRAAPGLPPDLQTSTSAPQPDGSDLSPAGGPPPRLHGEASTPWSAPCSNR